MADIKHTPGPWTWTPFIEGTAPATVHSEDANRIIAALPMRRDAEINANACLIAAAPDMLVLLKMLSGMDHHHTILAAIDATIAKATGK